MKERREEEEEENMEERERDVYAAKGEKRGLCCVKMKKDGGVFIVKGEGVGSAI